MVNPNDSLTIPHYEANDYTLSGKQRRGISQFITDAVDYQHHVEMAFAMSSPLGINTPIPDDLSKSIDLVAFSSGNDIRAFLGKPASCLSGASRSDQALIQQVV